MADKEEEASSPTSETGVSKACETPEIATTEDVPQSLEPQPSEAQNVNNDVAPAPKDKKSKCFVLIGSFENGLKNFLIIQWLVYS